MGYEGNILEKMKRAANDISWFCLVSGNKGWNMEDARDRFARGHNFLGEILGDSKRHKPGGWFDRINCEIGELNKQRTSDMPEIPNMQIMLERIVNADFALESTMLEETQERCTKLYGLLELILSNFDIKREKLFEQIDFLFR